MTSLRSRMFETTSAHTAAWLLGQGARVVVRDEEARRRVVALIRTRARDGADYARLLGQLRATGRAEPADEQALFAAAWRKKLIGVTGTNGKTTAVVWAAHLIGDAVALCSATTTPTMASLASKARVAVMEIPSLGVARTMVSTDDDHGSVPDADEIVQRWGAHNVPNYAAAVAAARHAGITRDTIRRRTATLPQVPHCQEVVRHERTLTVVDDAAATTPDRGIAAVHRWGGDNCILIAGGRGAGDWRAWADTVAAHITANNTVLVAGTATDRMRRALGTRGRGIRTYETPARAYAAAKKRAAVFLSATILYSPAAQVTEELNF